MPELSVSIRIPNRDFGVRWLRQLVNLRDGQGVDKRPDDPAKDLLDRLAAWINIGSVAGGSILLVAGIAVSHPFPIVLGVLSIVAGPSNMWMRRSPSDKGANLIERKPATTRDREAIDLPGTGQITVRRRKGTAIVGGQFEVSVDGQPVASLKSGAEVTLDVPSGEHSVQVRTENYASAPLGIEVAANRNTTVEVWGSMLRIRYAAHDPEQAIAIRRTNG